MLVFVGGVGVEGDHHLEENIHQVDNLHITLVHGLLISTQPDYLVQLVKTKLRQLCY